MTARHAGLLLGSAVAGAAGWWGPGAAAHWPAVAGVTGLGLRVEGDDGAVALTFDDGPHPEGTPAMFQALADAGAKATFFLIGEQVERYPEVVADVVAAGHEAAVHGYRHRSQMRLSPREVGRDLARATAVITEVSGAPARLYRPPYGAFTAGGLAVVRRAGLRPLLWSRWGRDWRPDATPQRITELTGHGLRAGDVVLLHDADWYSSPGAHRRTARALPAILDALTELGLRAVAARADQVGGAAAADRFGGAAAPTV